MRRITVLLSLTALVVAGVLVAIRPGPGAHPDPTERSQAVPLPGSPGGVTSRCAPGPADVGAPPDSRVAHDRVEELERELAQLQQHYAEQLTRQARHISALEARLARGQPRGDAVRPGTEPGPPGRADDTIAGDRDAVLFALEEHLAMQPVDPDWEREIELDLFGLFAETPGLDGNALVHASCGSTFCRVEFEHANATAESRLLAAVAQDATWSADYQDVFQYRPADGERLEVAKTSVFFVSRKGFTLPMSIE
jgi:hypothetical protein